MRNSKVITAYDSRKYTLTSSKMSRNEQHSFVLWKFWNDSAALTALKPLLNDRTKKRGIYVANSTRNRPVDQCRSKVMGLDGSTFQVIMAHRVKEKSPVGLVRYRLSTKGKLQNKDAQFFMLFRCKVRHRWFIYSCPRLCYKRILKAHLFCHMELHRIPIFMRIWTICHKEHKSSFCFGYWLKSCETS